MSDPAREARARSAALFGNEKVVEVVLSMRRRLPATAQILARETGLANNLVGAVLKKLADGGALERLPRTGPRSPLYFDAPTDRSTLDALVALCERLAPALDAVAASHRAGVPDPISPRPAS